MTADATRLKVGVLYASTVFLSAALIFFVQPMFAKMLLPSLGGAPAVWTTAMLFFQAMLLAGYAYSHYLTTRFSIPRQIMIHAVVGLAGVAFLPIAMPSGWTADPAQPLVAQSLWVFALGVGAPFFFLSANAPLLQAWYARCGGEIKLDPFYLYAASNAGSLLALLSFPLLAEPFFGAQAISEAWAAGYFVLMAALALCAVRVLTGARDASDAARASAAGVEATRYRADIGTLAKWIALAFIPSSLMLGVTSIASRDLGSFPLIWVIPLGLYLLTFIISFSESVRVPRWILELAMILSLSATIGLVATDMLALMGLLGFGVLFVAFFATALFYHCRLHDNRPPVEGLTVFYFAMATGGVLGGVFNSIIAPDLFDDVLETPIVLAAAGLALTGKRRLVADLPAVFLIAGLVAAAYYAIGALGLDEVFDWRQIYVVGAMVALALLVAGSRPYRFVSVAALLLLAANFVIGGKDVIYRDRSFFGAYSVKETASSGIRALYHGTTIHGSQYVEDSGSAPRILSYYHPKAPLGQLFLAKVKGADASVGVVGLGVGALSCYAEPGQSWRFYEIDPIVDEIARNPDLFSYMDQCAADAPTIFGDARIALAQEQGPSFDVLVIDAYSSDAVPVHLLTLEAFALYKSRLSPDGVLALHISNRHYKLAPIVARAADALGMRAMWRPAKSRDEADMEGGEAPSEVVVLSANPAPLTTLAAANSGWLWIKTDGQAPWTDDHASLLTALNALQ